MQTNASLVLHDPYIQLVKDRTLTAKLMCSLFCLFARVFACHLPGLFDASGVAGHDDDDDD